MRNLKRVLSLALASVMLLGMMVIGAGAADKTFADLTDSDKIANQEAVSLMVDLGIIEGKPDGSYDPSATVDRATMAKLITMLLMGDVDQSAFEGTKTDLTDIDNSWAEGYIKFCYSNGIITGDGQGHFFPTEPVTVVQAAKMLLVAVGYDATDRGYTNDPNWSVNIMRDAQSTTEWGSGTVRSMTKGLSVKATDPLTRDNAAQMIFNTLFVTNKKPVYAFDMGVQYISSYQDQASLASTTYSIEKIEAVVTGVDAYGKAEVTVNMADKSATQNAALQAILNAKLPATVDAVGNKVVAYYNTSTNKLVSTALVVADSAVLATVTTGFATSTDYTKATTKGEKTFVAELEAEPSGNSLSPVVTYFLNGVKASGGNNYGIGISDKRAGGTNAGGAANTTTDIVPSMVVGSVIEFIDTNGNGKADVVKVTKKNVATVTADPTTKEVGDAVQVKVPGIINAFSSANTTETVKGYSDLKKGDVVLWVTIGNTTYIEKCATVEGVAVAKNSASSIKIGDTYYAESGLTGKSYSAASWTDYKNTYTFYLDNGNNIVKAVAQTNEVSSNYAVALKTAWVGGSGAIGESNYAQAQLLKADGTVEVVTIATIDGYTPVAVGTNLGTNYSDSANSSSNSSKTSVTAGEKCDVYEKNTSTAYKFIGVDGSATLSNKFYTYSVNSDGKYVLTSKTTSGTLSSDTLTNNKANFASTFIGNANTVFLVKGGTASAPTYTVYTGIANVPGMTSASGIVLNDKSGVATYVYISSTGTLTGEVGQYLYVPANEQGGISYTLYPATSTSAAYYEVSAIFNGEAKAVKLASTSGVFATDWSTLTANNMFKVTNISSDEIISGVSAAADATGVKVVKGVVSNSGNTLVVTGSLAYSYDADTVVYMISADGTVSTPDAASIEVDSTDDLLIEYNTANNYAKTIYVMQRNVSTASVTAVDVYVNGQKATLDGGASATAGTLTTKLTDPANVGAVISLKVTVNNEGTAVVSDHVVTSSDITGKTVSFTISLTAEDGTALSNATYTLTIAA
ncbi:S-layer homology domain-containing protein [Pseudoflavonifractor sp.]|jgi:hypothetical protein|uniref:S-layer homology domain-containing protein n=1 Tax=Pseudoflavonifractor sp. TaxID=1980281 RepID=UPI003D917411